MNLVLNTKLYNILVSLWSVIFDSSKLQNVLITDIKYFTRTIIFYIVCVRSMICHCHGNPWIAARLWNALPIKAAASDASQNPCPGNALHYTSDTLCDTTRLWRSNSVTHAAESCRKYYCHTGFGQTPRSNHFIISQINVVYRQ